MGLEHQFCWISAKGGQVSIGIPAIGNMANAVAVATTHAVKVSITRIKVYRTELTFTRLWNSTKKFSGQ